MPIIYDRQEDIKLGSDKMAYDICKKCQRFFEQNGGQYCGKCDNELSLSRDNINEYLQSNPGASIMEIVNETGVKIKDINMFLKSGGAYIEDSYSEKEFVNLRQEELEKRQEITCKKENVKLKNEFRSRRLRGD